MAGTADLFYPPLFFRYRHKWFSLEARPRVFSHVMSDIFRPSETGLPRGVIAPSPNLPVLPLDFLKNFRRINFNGDFECFFPPFFGRIFFIFRLRFSCGQNFKPRTFKNLEVLFSNSNTTRPNSINTISITRLKI
jgi:hypothetical protein